MPRLNYRLRPIVAGLIALLLGAGPSFGAERTRDARTVYRQDCARCHGKAGEGVKGKYDDPLEGDWSLEKLTRYIGKNMPEDDPGSCSQAEVEAVSRFIYENFYSLEARIRKNPPKIEFARLTNRQYLNSVADLLRNFTWRNDEAPKEQGLRATYYNARGFNRDKKLFDRVDPRVDFDFTEKSPEGVTTNEFAIQWRGSLVPRETGVYEFIVKTPLGMRLYVNDDQEPLIDGWVSSGQMVEHRATIKLIGGRTYPLRVDCFRFQDKTASISLLWKPPFGFEEVIPESALSTSRSASTFVLKTSFPADDSSAGYERGVSISKEWDEACTQAALETAGYVLKNLDPLSKSKPSDTNRAEKVETFCRDLVTAAFRRPLEEEETKRYVTSRLKSAPKMEDGVTRVVLMALMSPNFLYPELEYSQLEQYRVASRLALTLWDSLPDKELVEAARDGKLASEDQIRKQATRMLKDVRARAKLDYFFSQWLRLPRADDLVKDKELFPDFSPELISDLKTSLMLFLDDVVWSGESDYRRLLLADSMYVNERIATFYGIKAEATNGFVKVTVPEKERAGIITHPYLLAALSYAKSTSPIHRGVFLTRNIMGRMLRPPPVATVFKDADFDPKLNMREKVTELTKSQACQSCHVVINPLGFSMEHFDAVGRFRTEEKGREIDAVAEFIKDDGDAVRLTSPRDVAEMAVTTPHAQTAFIQQLFHQLVKQPVLAYGQETMNHLLDSFIGSDFNIQKLVVETAVVSASHDLLKNKPPKST